MNNVVLIGRLTKDPELQYTQTGLAIIKFTLAVNRQARGEAEFIRITAFDKTAELISQYLSKGSQLGVQGRIQTGSFKNKENQTVYTTDVIADKVEFLSRASESRQEINTSSAEGLAPAEGFAKVDSALPF